MRTRTAAFFLSFIVALHAQPCGPYFPPAIVWQDTGDSLLKMPKANMYAELLLHFGGARPAPDGSAAEENVAQWDRDAADLRSALEDTNLDSDRKEALVAAYREVRRITSQLSFSMTRQGMERPLLASPRPSDYTPGPAFDFAVFRPLFDSLPKEFGYYAEGAMYYNLGRFDHAVAAWQALLDLPPDERHYRTVWAAYMLGRALLYSDPEAAIPYFQMARTSVDDGLPDALALYTPSLGWQARAEAILGNYHDAYHHYIDQFRQGTDHERNAVLISLDYVGIKLFKSGAMPENVVNDPLCREVITLWMVSGRHYLGMNEWADALAATPPVGAIEHAGDLAHLYYTKGRFDQAARWVEFAGPEDVAARWVHAKLLLRDGKLDDAEREINGVRESLVANSPSFTEYVANRMPLREALGTDLGAVRLNQDDYAGALSAFLQAGRLADASYIADQVMTADELAAFLDKATEETFAPPQHWEEVQSWPAAVQFRYILARKLARKGNFERARPHYPDKPPSEGFGESNWPDSMPAVLDQYAAALKQGYNTKTNKQERADALFEAAMIARKWGMELMGTEMDPDYAIFHGVYIPWGETRAKAGTATKKEADRVTANAPTPDRRFHYRWTAANLLWEAAELLPDNDEKTAQALWFGGTWIEKDDPHGADKFYKALVRRCRKLPIGQEANEKRWFPEKPEGWKE